MKWRILKNSVAFGPEANYSEQRPPLVGEVIANFFD
jgi:hypothetical protein